MKTMWIPACAGISLLFCAATARAQESLDHLPLPRWASLAANEVNMRTGPGKRYPIDWVLKKKYLPVEITKEFENWRFIREPDGATGWVQRYMLTSGRTALITESSQPLYKNPSDAAAVVARLQKGVIVRLQACQTGWCHAEVESFEGWLPKTVLWGVYPHEVWE